MVSNKKRLIRKADSQYDNEIQNIINDFVKDDGFYRNISKDITDGISKTFGDVYGYLMDDFCQEVIGKLDNADIDENMVQDVIRKNLNDIRNGLADYVSEYVLTNYKK
jgi:hypothetical protein|nr:MAG TPA: hypothetical protein [Caudoviricetes sp.]